MGGWGHAFCKRDKRESKSEGTDRQTEPGYAVILCLFLALCSWACLTLSQNRPPPPPRVTAAVPLCFTHRRAPRKHERRSVGVPLDSVRFGLTVFDCMYSGHILMSDTDTDTDTAAVTATDTDTGGQLPHPFLSHVSLKLSACLPARRHTIRKNTSSSIR